MTVSSKSAEEIKIGKLYRCKREGQHSYYVAGGTIVVPFWWQWNAKTWPNGVRNEIILVSFIVGDKTDSMNTTFDQWSEDFELISE